MMSVPWFVMVTRVEKSTVSVEFTLDQATFNDADQRDNVSDNDSVNGNVSVCSY